MYLWVTELDDGANGADGLRLLAGLIGGSYFFHLCQSQFAPFAPFAQPIRLLCHLGFTCALIGDPLWSVLVRFGPSRCLDATYNGADLDWPIGRSVAAPWPAIGPPGYFGRACRSATAGTFGNREVYIGRPSIWGPNQRNKLIQLSGNRRNRRNRIFKSFKIFFEGPDGRPMSY